MPISVTAPSCPTTRLARRPSEAGQDVHFSLAMSTSSMLTANIYQAEMLFAGRVSEKAMQWKRNAEDPLGLFEV